MYVIKNTKKSSRVLIGILPIAFCMFFGISGAEAASISLRPSVQSVSSGNIVSVKVSIGTDGKYINNSDGVIQFPTDLLSVLSVSKSNSIFSLWVEDPKFSNSDGVITFNGGLPNPGYSGSNGEVLTVTFKTKKPGTASLIFGGTSVRENDGLGTDILTSKQSGSIQIVGATEQKPVEKPVVNTPVPDTSKGVALAKPVVVSSSHPKNDVWYKGKTASFSWTIANNVTAIQASLNEKELTVPSVSYDGSVSRRTLNDLADGVYYFNLRQKNGAGWSPTAHYKVQIDSTEPEDFTPVVTEVDSRNIVTLDAKDKTSGIEYYTLKVGSDKEVKVSVADLKDGEYILDLQPKGTHTLSVVAYDKAGNSREQKVTFVSPDIESPKITLSSESIELGENLTVFGTSLYKKAKVQIQVEFANGKSMNYEEVTDDEGKFVVVVNNIESKGTGYVTAGMVLGSSSVTESQEKIYFKVRNIKGIEDFSAIAYPALGILVAVCAALATLFALYLGWHRFFSLRRRYRKDLEVTIGNVHSTMLVLKRELKSQLKILQAIQKDRDLNEKEEKIFEDIQSNIDDVEKFIQDKIKKLM